MYNKRKKAGVKKMALKYQEVAKDLAHKIFTKAYTDKLPSEGEC